MAARWEKTRVGGIYKRGDRYVVTYRANGKQRRESTRTMAEARRLKAARIADIARGEFHEASRLRFRDYAEEWIGRYQGRRGMRETTRAEYRSQLRRYAFSFFGSKTLSEITPRDMANFVGWLCDESKQGKRLSDSTVKNLVKPVRACLATAMAEGLIRNNPAQGLVYPHRPRVQTDEEKDVRVLTREQLATFLAVVHSDYASLFELLATTGLRISEAVGLEWRHIALDGSRPHVKVQRAIVRGREHPPKTRHGRREVPLSHELVRRLRRRRMASPWSADDHPVFATSAGTPLDPDNLRHRHLRPAAEEAGVPWIGFHTFRHTCASILFERGANAVQVQHWLGHHSPAFTLDTYVHLLSKNLGEPLDLVEELRLGSHEQSQLASHSEIAAAESAVPRPAG